MEVGTSVRWKPDPLGLRDHEHLAMQGPSSLPSPEDAARVVLSHVIRTLGSAKRRQAEKDKRPGRLSVPRRPSVPRRLLLASRWSSPWDTSLWATGFTVSSILKQKSKKAKLRNHTRLVDLILKF